jgi:hypothetical protein
MSMPPFLKVLVKSLATHVHKVTANLAWVLYTETMKLIQPVGNRLAIPS